MVVANCNLMILMTTSYFKHLIFLPVDTIVLFYIGFITFIKFGYPRVVYGVMRYNFCKIQQKLNIIIPIYNVL